MNFVTCDKCGKEFSIKPHEKKHGKGIIETYFNCPHCNEHYTAYVTNAAIRSKQREIKKLGDQLHTITDMEKYNKAFARYRKMKQELEPKMNQLKNKIQSKVIR